MFEDLIFSHEVDFVVYSTIEDTLAFCMIPIGFHDREVPRRMSIHRMSEKTQILFKTTELFS